MRLMILLAAVLAAPLAAQPPSGGATTPGHRPGFGPQFTPVASAEEVLAEVNAARARRGLRPFRLDMALAEGAFLCAAYRAETRTEGHTPNDFRFLPPGASARAAGCAAWPAGTGWGSCCTYDDYQFAGAAFCVGPDGKRYMHLFVR